MLSKTFAERLRQARKERGLAQVDIARLLDARGSATVHRWEAGQSFPGLEAVDKLAEFYGKPASWFFNDGDDGANSGVIVSNDTPPIGPSGADTTPAGDSPSKRL